MNQSAIIGGVLLAGFALFLASRNRLSVYGRIMWGAKPASHSGGEITERPKLPSGSTDYEWSDIFKPGEVLENVYEDLMKQLPEF